MQTPLLYVVVGLVVGVLIGLTGVGGGSVTTPVMILLFGQSPAVAVGTDLVFSATTKAAATAALGFGRRIDWVIVRRLILGSVPGATLGLMWFWFQDAPSLMDPLIARSLAVVLMLGSVSLLLLPLLTRVGMNFMSTWVSDWSHWHSALTSTAGLLIGLAVAVTSVGAGALGVAALLWLYPLRLPTHRLVATDIAYALPVTLIAGLGHAALGHVNLPAVGCLLVGSIPGVLLASKAAIRLPPTILRLLMAPILALAAERLWMEA